MGRVLAPQPPDAVLAARGIEEGQAAVCETPEARDEAGYQRIVSPIPFN